MKKYKKSFHLILVALLICFTAIFTGRFVNAIQLNNKLSQEKPAKFVSMDKAMTLNKPIAVEFYAKWCGYCKRFAPVLDQLNSEYCNKYSFVKIDAENPKNSALVKKYNINSYPSFYLYDPKTNKTEFVDQAIYTQPELVKKELDKFYESINSAK